MEQLDFLDRIWGTANGYVQLQQRRKDAEGNRTGDPTDNKEFLWNSERDRIGRHMSIRLDDDLYFAVPIYKSTSRRQSEIKFISAVYVDDDGVDGSVTGGYKLPPSITVWTSPQHSHNYWVLSEPAEPTRALRVGFEISAFHKHDNKYHAEMVEAEAAAPDEKKHKFCGTDPGGWDSTQILRVPGSHNKKPEYTYEYPEGYYIEWEDFGHTYTLEELENAYPKTEAEYVSLAAIQIDQIPAELPQLEPLLAQLGGRSDLIDLYTSAPTGRGSSSGWDERLYALENELFRMGFTAPEVYRVALTSACNKFARGVRQSDGTYAPRPQPELDLWRDVYKAQAAHGQRESTWTAVEYDRGSTFEEGIEEQTVDARPRPPAFKMELLTKEEIERVEKRETFITKYVAWAKSKTDAAVVYHVASAFTILSLVFGEFGHASPKFGKLRLNLWFLVMGKTTRARKSTSRSLMIKVVKGVTSSLYKYDEGSDFTPEGLTTALAAKPRQSSLIHRDEVQGMFKEINGKNYMSGLSDLLTALYDGEVSGKLRTSSGNSESTEVNFVLFLMGIVSKITDILTLEDFQSGFLSRFIHVIGEAPARTRESEWLDQAPVNEVMHGDPVYLELVSELMKGRTHWAKVAPDRFTVSVRFEDDAWTRWNEANWELQEAVQQHERAEILEAALDRMGKSAIKAAALLAMADKRDKVNLEDVLVALYYMNGWAEDMVRSSEMVAESFWRKDMNKMEEIILTKGGLAKWEDVFAKMDKKPHDFSQLVESLVLSGKAVIQTDATSKARWLEIKS